MIFGSPAAFMVQPQPPAIRPWHCSCDLYACCAKDCARVPCTRLVHKARGNKQGASSVAQRSSARNKASRQQHAYPDAQSACCSLSSVHSFTITMSHMIASGTARWGAGVHPRQPRVARAPDTCTLRTMHSCALAAWSSFEQRTQRGLSNASWRCGHVYCFDCPGA